VALAYRQAGSKNKKLQQSNKYNSGHAAVMLNWFQHLLLKHKEQTRDPENSSG
jgi:hypothetical protein